MNNHPITADEFAQTLANSSFDTDIAVALSGGIDSMALLYLLHAWAAPRGIRLHALTVDHRLRPESAYECSQVKKWCEALDVAHTTLVWQHDSISRAVQQQARDARYRLMLDWCRANRIHHLFTAHHRDDQIETFFFRLMRGSGLEGLSAILPLTTRHGIALHRPLLAFSKSRLQSTLTHPHLEDPSNRNMRYTRNAIRRVLEVMSEDEKDRVSQLTFFFQTFRKQLEDKISSALMECFQLHAAGFGLLDFAAFMHQEPGLQTRIAEHICMLIGGDGEPQRSEKIARLRHALLTPSPNKKMMLGGAMFQFMARKNTWLAVREKKRVARPVFLTQTPQLWDGRFEVSCAQSGYYVAALGEHAKQFAEMLAQVGIPKPAWAILPALFRLEDCVALPHMHWRHPELGPLDAQIEFIAAKSLAAAPRSARMLRNNNFKGERARA